MIDCTEKKQNKKQLHEYIKNSLCVTQVISVILHLQ
jgi:hypothetical protein